MLFRLINKVRDRWLRASDCPVRHLLGYMESHGKLRDAQLESIKTYLFLKIACENKPLWKLMYDGQLNSLSERELDELQLKSSTRDFLKSHPEAQALYEYATSKDDKGVSASQKLAEEIENAPAVIDYESTIKSLFYGVSYTDYLFSLPMGAGKTWLMASFIYLNLYFAATEPDNALFARNFIVLAPAGLKTSIIPSLKSIREFDPTLVLPEPAASQIRLKLKFEILEDDNSAKGSNITKNPNAVKIQRHQPFETAEGLVVIANAEKLYDRIGKSSDYYPGLDFLLSEKERTEWMKVRFANELRSIIAKLPGLCIMIDEVHHASERQLLRKVVEEWVEEDTFNSVLGFSGTPFLSSAEKVEISDALTLKNTMLANVVVYYPLVKAVGNFLKLPVIKASDLSYEDIINHGVREFLTLYKDVSYPGVGSAKMAIYCGGIEKLETVALPLVTSICDQYGIDPNEAILKYYRDGNKGGYKCPPDSETRFMSLDSEISKVRIILLVFIGKEGWNCKSLTSVILPGENSSPKNMVLQTSCRCLREVVNAKEERALIWLNKFNEKKLDEQLKKEHHTSISEIQKAQAGKIMVERHSRRDVVNLPDLSYIQLRFSYNAVECNGPDTETRLKAVRPEEIVRRVIKRKKIGGKEYIEGQSKDFSDIAVVEFNHWLNIISKESFGLIPVSELRKHVPVLRKLFDKVSMRDKNGLCMLNPNINQERLRSDIRKCFSSETKISFKKEALERRVSLLKEDSIALPYFASSERILCPSEKEVREILKADSRQEIPAAVVAAVEALQAQGLVDDAEALRMRYSTENRQINTRTYHYLPYSFDSSFENLYYLNILRGMLYKYEDVEIYFNGDDSLTEFYIDCYKFEGGYWRNIGRYYPDFLILKRDEAEEIGKVIMVETKGEVFEADFKPKKDFMPEFIHVNNELGTTRFEFLYIPETDLEDKRYNKTKQKIEKFLNS